MEADTRSRSKGVSGVRSVYNFRRAKASFACDAEITSPVGDKLVLTALD